jgi:hypothetical protein
LVKLRMMCSFAVGESCGVRLGMQVVRPQPEKGLVRIRKDFFPSPRHKNASARMDRRDGSTEGGLRAPEAVRREVPGVLAEQLCDGPEHAALDDHALVELIVPVQPAESLDGQPVERDPAQPRVH